MDLATRYGVFRESEAELFGIGRKRNGTPKAHRMLRGVYCVLPAPWSAEARFTAAVLAGGPGALLTGDSWLQAFGIVDRRPLAPVEVLLGHDCRRVDNGFALFSRSRWLEEAGFGERLRLACPLAKDVGIASARSVLTRFAAEWSPEEIRATSADLTHRRITSPSAMLEWTALHPYLPGAEVATWAAHELIGGEDSEGEIRFIAMARELGLPPDAGHVKIYRGGELLSITDAWWDIGVPGFYDGKLHLLPSRSDSDTSRREVMRDAGLAPFSATAVLIRDRKQFDFRLRTRQREAADAPRKLWRRTGDRIDLFPVAA